MLNAIVDEVPFISIITKMEVLGFNFKSIDEQNVTETFFNGSMVLGIDNEITLKTIHIRKAIKIKLPDAIIAATAFVNDLTLITNNTKDFLKIDGLQIINPFEL